MNPNQMYPNLAGGGTPQSMPQMSQPTQPPIGEVATKEEVQDVLDFITTIEQDLQKTSATFQAGENSDMQLRQQLLQEIFSDLAEHGVDLSDQQSVAAFLAKLQAANPEVAASFVEAIDYLLGAPQEPESVPGQENMIPEEEVPPEIPGMVETPANVAPAPASPPATPFSSL